MNTAFEGVPKYDDDDDDELEIVIPRGRVGSRVASNDESEEEEEQPKKRRKLEPKEVAAESNEDDSRKPPQKPRVELTQFQQEKLDLAKSKLSKWAARLFDPNRPRGLVEPPKT